MLSREDGFTLPEMLVAMSVALIVSLAAFSLIEVTMRRSGDVAARVDTSQRARTAMDRITQQLRGQVCLSTTVGPIVAASSTSVTFYVDFTDQSSPDTPPERHTLTFDGTASTITEDVYVGTSNHLKPPTFTYPAAPTRSRTLLTNVEQAPGAPVFAYYGFDTAKPPQPTLALPSPLSVKDVARVARIDVAFLARPAGKSASKASVTLQDQISVREADPNTYTTDAAGLVTAPPAPACS